MPLAPRLLWLRGAVPLAAAVATSVLLAAAAPAAAPVPDPALASLQTRLGDGFTRGDPDRLASMLSPRLKTYVACAPLGVEDGYYGADQMRLLFRRLFRDRHTVRFRASDPVLRPRPDGRALLRAVWTYRQSGAAPVEVRLAFTLGKEGSLWRVREIREFE